jgi:hypothetical protein
LTAQELWEVRRLEWIRQFVRLGKYPNGISKNNDEKRAGQWQSQTRKHFKKGKLSEIRIELLNNIEGWKWVDSENRAEIISRTFEESLDNWIEQFVKLGRNPNGRSKNNDEKRAGTWQSLTRTYFKKGNLSELRIELLNNTEGWKWVGSEIIIRTFEESLDNWKEHFVRLGKYPKQRSEDDNKKRARTWQSNTRKYYKKDKLSEEQIELLNNTEGWKWVDSENRAEIIRKTFEESLDDWKEHFVRFGKYPNKRSEDYNEKRAGQWQKQIRKYYKIKKLSEEQIELLNNTEGWKWGVRSK